jgi:hypothetical protein
MRMQYSAICIGQLPYNPKLKGETMNEVNEASGDSGVAQRSELRPVVMCDWNCIFDKMPEHEQVVLIHVKSLGKHGIVSAWWHIDGDKSCWVALDDAITYQHNEAEYWRELVALPDYT